MQVDHNGRRLQIRWQWFTPGVLAMTLFCFLWDSFLLVWYTSVFHSHPTPWVVIIFPVFHVAVGVRLTYAVLCGFANSTRVEISPDGLIVSHGPLPSVGNRVVSASQIRQPFCERTTVGKNSGSRPTFWTIGAYSVSAILNDGTKVKLVRGIRELADARYLERQIELAMNIAPQPVAGECTA